MPAGVYQYCAAAHALAELATGDPRPQLRKVYVQPEFAERAAVTVILAARVRRALAKCPVRHYRTLHVDTGIATQNLYLVATALGLRCCAVTGYCDAAARQLLQLDDREFPTLLFAAAHAPSPADAGCGRSDR